MLLTELSSFYTQFQALALLLFTLQTSPAAHMSYYPCSTHFKLTFLAPDHPNA